MWASFALLLNPEIMLTYIRDRITVDPNLCGGKPTIRGKRRTVEIVLGYLAAGDSPAEVLESYPFLEMADITACLEFAAENLARQNFVAFAA